MFKKILSLFLFLLVVAFAHADSNGSSELKQCHVPPPAAISHKADALVVACVDYRFMKHIADVLDAKGLEGKYSLVTLAGASLAASNDLFPSWKDTFWSHLAFLVNLHKIDSVILIDHRDCGMYKFVYGRDLALDPADEKSVHQHNMEEIKEEIHRKYPQLAVKLWLMDTNGDIEELGN